MSYELLSRKFIGDMKQVHNLSKDDEIVIIKLFFTDTNYNTVVHKAYTLLDCFGEYIILSSICIKIQVPI
jgi:hypothetical protein